MKLIIAFASVCFISTSFCIPPRLYKPKKLKIDCKKAIKEAKEKRKNKKDWPPMSFS